MCIVQYTWLVKRHKRFFPGVEKRKGRNFAFFAFFYTPARTHLISGLKSRVLKLSFFDVKMMVKSGLVFFFYFEIQQAPSEIAAKLPGQFTHSGQIL